MIKRLLVLALIPVVMSGCASMPDPKYCAVAGAAHGGVAGALVDDEATAAVGAVIGALIGYAICHEEEGDDDRDGVLNNKDECPGTPAGVEVDAVGCPLDSDGDGIPDYRDNCPNTPEGVAVGPEGCPLDSDGDGVPDYLDTCPGTAAGIAVDESGCPLDSDGDGVPDYQDKCPGTMAGSAVDADGCPPVGAELDILNMEFDFDKSNIRDEYKPRLDTDVKVLQDNPNMTIMIEGHTDSTGPEAYNQALSERRANSVKDYMVEGGVDAGRMETVGKGESEPVADNGTREGRAQNRRVELTVTGK